MLDFNPQFTRTLELFKKTGQNVFVTGMAGTGKSTVIDYLRKTSAKNTVFLASTGVAAVNIGGQTLHSFFRFGPDITTNAVKEIKIRRDARKMYRELETVVIDEISMVRADVLDCVDEFLRIHGPRAGTPFGGVRMFFVGDLHQLPPVTQREEESIFNGGPDGVYESRYFFDSRAFKGSEFMTVHLEKVYRQKDPDFVEVLKKIRDNTAGEKELKYLNARCSAVTAHPGQEFYIYLATTNAIVNRINEQKLNELNGKCHFYLGTLTGKFKQNNMPTGEEIHLKTGAQVMLLNNDAEKRWVNGTVGRIVKIEKCAGDDIIVVELADGRVVDVAPFTWDMYNFTYDQTSKTIKSDKVGSFRQFPLKLAWAITIHKSQGKTFEKVIIDIGGGTFDYGQMYVALSRCTSVDGIILKTPVRPEHIKIDAKVKKFLNQYQV